MPTMAHAPNAPRRGLPGELGRAPGKTSSLRPKYVNAAHGARAERLGSQMKFLHRIDRIETGAGDPPRGAAGSVGELKLFVPLEGLVDLAAGRTRLDKELAKFTAEKGKR